MRLNAMLKFAHTADLYDYTPLNNGTDEVSYHFVKEVVCNVNTQDAGPRIIVTSPTPMRKGMQLANIRGRDGLEVTPGAAYRVTAILPNIDALGNLNGYKMTAAMSIEPTFSEA